MFMSIEQNRLALITAHDALLLLKSSMSTPKLTHLLRAAPCAGHSALAALDKILHNSISVLLNSDLSDDQWAQASLPVKSGGLGTRKPSHLAPSAFLSSVNATRAM